MARTWQAGTGVGFPYKPRQAAWSSVRLVDQTSSHIASGEDNLAKQSGQRISKNYSMLYVIIYLAFGHVKYLCRVPRLCIMFLQIIIECRVPRLCTYVSLNNY